MMNDTQSPACTRKALSLPVSICWDVIKNKTPTISSNFVRFKHLREIQLLKTSLYVFRQTEMNLSILPTPRVVRRMSVANEDPQLIAPGNFTNAVQYVWNKFNVRGGMN